MLISCLIYLTYKCSKMSPGNPLILGSKDQGYASQKHCCRGSLHSCECWLLLVADLRCVGTRLCACEESSNPCWCLTGSKARIVIVWKASSIAGETFYSTEFSGASRACCLIDWHWWWRLVFIFSQIWDCSTIVNLLCHWYNKCSK